MLGHWELAARPHARPPNAVDADVPAVALVDRGEALGGARGEEGREDVVLGLLDGIPVRVELPRAPRLMREEASSPLCYRGIDRHDERRDLAGEVESVRGEDQVYGGRVVAVS